jgi:hypothetical protein
MPASRRVKVAGSVVSITFLTLIWLLLLQPDRRAAAV